LHSEAALPLVGTDLLLLLLLLQLLLLLCCLTHY
jgi:hypothetical protein